MEHENEAVRHLTLLHSNDMHGDFLPEMRGGKKTGGLALLSGYLGKCRETEKNVLYAISGDMFRGSIIDSEYMGLSTIELVNQLRPTVATIGNHEVDYGLAHLLFLEKCANFPIINANLFITMNNKRLFRPYEIVEIDGMQILFIGILTEEVLASAKNEKVIGSFVDVVEAAKEIGIICDNYRTVRTDLTVVLSHIGIEKDRELAALLPRELGVNLILGGHSHTFMDAPEVVNGITLVQAGTGTDVIGRFDIDYDISRRRIRDCRWSCVPITEDNAAPDPVMEEMLARYKHTTDTKYKRVVTNLRRALTHPARNRETELGNLYADMLQDESSFDIMLFASGSIRKTTLGPVVEYQELLECTPYDDQCWMIEVTGAQFRRMVMHLLRDEAWEGHTEFYQVSRGVRIVYNKTTHELLELSFNGSGITDGQRLKLCLQDYHFKSFDEFFGVPMAEVRRNFRPRVIAVSVNNIIEEYLSTHPDLDAHVEGRITIVE